MSAQALGWNDALRFGKYKGLLVSEVASFNPGYLAWAVNHLDNFEMTVDARKRGQRELNFHREQAEQRQNGWAWGFGGTVRKAAEAWRTRLDRLEREARKAAEIRAKQETGHA